MNSNRKQLIITEHIKHLTGWNAPWNSWFFSHSSRIEFKDGGNVVAVWYGDKGIYGGVRMTSQLSSHWIIGTV